MGKYNAGANIRPMKAATRTPMNALSANQAADTPAGMQTRRIAAPRIAVKITISLVAMEEATSSSASLDFSSLFNVSRSLLNVKSVVTMVTIAEAIIA